MATSDEDLDKKRKDVQTLREQVADAAAQRESRERGLTNDITAAQLDAEAARLRAELAALKEATKASAIKDSATPLAVAQEDAKEAAAAAKAAEKGQG